MRAGLYFKGTSSKYVKESDFFVTLLICVQLEYNNQKRKGELIWEAIQE